MKRFLIALLLVLTVPSQVHATATTWDFAGSTLQPLQSQWAARIKGAFFQATSTTPSIFPYASTTGTSATFFCLSADCITAWPSGGAGISALGATGQTQTGATQTFATTSDANVGLTITSAGNVHTFTSTWAGTLADSRVSDTLTIGAGSTVADAALSGNVSLLGQAISNSELVNSTISGVALGSNLAGLNNDTTLVGTSYNGGAAVSDWGLDLSNPNTWTALQQFNANASTTQLTVSGSTYLATASGSVGIRRARKTGQVSGEAGEGTRSVRGLAGNRLTAR